MDEMHAVQVQTGKSYKGFFGFRRIVWEMPLLWLRLPILYLPGIFLSGQWIYGVVAGNQLPLEGRCARHDCAGRSRNG